MTRYSMDTVKIHETGMAAALVLRGIGSFAHNLGLTSIGPDSGAPYDEVRFVGEQKVAFDFTTPAIASILDTIAFLTGRCLDGDVTGDPPGFDAFMQAHDPCGTNARTAGSTHARMRGRKSHVIVTSLSGTKGQSAVAAIHVYALTIDGATAPTSVVYNAALPASYILDEEFVIGAPTVAGFEIDPTQISQWSIESGIQLDEIMSAGSIYCGAVDIRKIRPRARIAIDDAAALDAAKIPYNGVVCEHADTIFPLIKRDPFGGLIALTAEEHILGTMSGFAYLTNHASTSGSNVAVGEIVIEGTEDATAQPPVIWETGQALEVAP
jgi:hypothetical protein